MPLTPKEPKGQDINIELPKGLSEETYHSLSRKLVGEYATLSQLEGALPENAAVLNDSTWTLTIPAGLGHSVSAMKSRLRSIPEAAGAQVEETIAYGVPPGEND